MTRPDFSTREGVEAYRAELRQVGRRPRLFGFGLILAGAALTLLAPYAGAMGQAVQWAGYAALAAGWTTEELRKIGYNEPAARPRNRSRTARKAPAGKPAAGATTQASIPAPQGGEAAASSRAGSADSAAVRV